MSGTGFRLPRLATIGLALLLWLGLAPPARGVEIPPEGSCPPYPLRPGQEAPSDEDVVPLLVRPGTRVDLGDLQRLENYLPREVWERRDTFFFEGMRLEVGPCHRRYPAPPFFEQATRESAGRVQLDADGNLKGYGGVGLPFPVDGIPDDAPDAGTRWAWNYRYRYQAAGFRGDFRILHVARRGRSIEHYEGEIFWLPLHSLPEELLPRDGNGKQFAAGGRFKKPLIARGVAWRQFRLDDADRDYARADEIFVWVPEERKVRRSAPIFVEGMFMPTYTRGTSIAGGKLQLPDASISTPDISVGVTEHWRRGFVGLFLRPNAYRFKLLEVADVIAPINTAGLGYPQTEERSYGPSGLSVADDRWDIRRAVVIEGTSRSRDQPIAFVKLWIDAQTQQPLYVVTRRPNRLIEEVGIFVGRYSGDDPLGAKWAGSGTEFGVIEPVAQTFFVAGEGGWLRESFALRSDPPSDAERKDFTSTVPMQQRAR